MIALLFIALQAAAAAPEPPPTPEELAAEAPEARRTMHDFTICALRRHRSDAERMLALEGDSPAYRQLGMQVIDSQCVARGAQFRFNWPLFRGGLYEALYLRDFGAGAASSFDGVPPLPYIGGGAWMNLQDRARNAAILQVAECMVRAGPDDARALLASAVASPEEEAVFGRVEPRAAPCHAEGAPAESRRPILRGLVAEALYRLSFAARRSAGH
jgi:hypothetical protein